MPRRSALFLGGIVLLGGIARFATLDLQSFHHDEAVTAGRVIAPNLLDTLELVAESERSPPLYYLLAWPWTKLFGTGEVGLRSLSALIGTATIPAAFLAGRELASRRIGLLAAAFVALNPYLIWYSQEARSYALLVLFGALALAFFARARRRPEPHALLGWAAFSALALLSHYFAVFLIAPMALWLLAPRRGRLRGALAVGTVALVGLTLVPLAVVQEGEGRRNAFTRTPLAERGAEVALGFAAGEEPDPLKGTAEVDAVQLGAGAGGGALLLLGAALVVRRGRPQERDGAKVAAIVVVASIGAPLFLAAAGLDLVRPRNLVASLVPLILVLACGFGGRRAGRPGLLGAAATLLLFASATVAINASRQMQRVNWRAAAEAIGATDVSRLIVAPRNGDDPLTYYLGAERLKGSGLGEGVAVRRIDVLASGAEVGEPPPGFRLVSERSLSSVFTLRRYEAQRPSAVERGEVRGRRLLKERSTAIVDGLASRQ